MGCNCKNKNKNSVQPLMKQEISEIKEVSLEKLNSIMERIEKINSDQEARSVVEPLLLEILGYILPPYCDQVCQKSLKIQIQKLIDAL